MKDYGTGRNISGSSSKVNNVTANDFKDCFFLPSIFLIEYMVIVETEWLHVQSNIQISVYETEFRSTSGRLQTSG